MTTCLNCGAPAPIPATGRPASYCSTGCRRAAQSERQRIVRHLSRLEELTMELRHAVRRGSDSKWSTPGGYLTADERLADVQVDIVALTKRLTLLSNDGGEPE